MRCPKCKSNNVKYIFPLQWNYMHEDKSKHGGYTCKECGNEFSFLEGVYAE